MHLFVRALKTADAANARLPASLLAKPAAVLQISSAKMKTNNLFANNQQSKLPPNKAAIFI